MSTPQRTSDLVDKPIPDDTDLIRIAATAPVGDFSITYANLKASIRVRLTLAENVAGLAVSDIDTTYNPGDTRRYPNGLADAISVAEVAEATSEKRIIFSASETISSGLTIIGDRIDVRAVGDARLTYTGTGDAVTLGSAATLARGLYWKVPILKSGQDWDDGTDTTSRGLVLARCDESTIWVDIEGFNDGFALYGTNGGNVHNDIRIILVLDCRRGFVADRGIPAGWNNSNIIRAGLITYRSGTFNNACDNLIVTRHIDLVHESDNELNFIGVALEAATIVARTAAAESMLIRCNGGFHQWFKGRIETSNITWSQYIRWDTDAQFNVFDGGRFPTAVALSTFLDDSAIQNTNSLLNFANINRHGSNRGIIAGVVQATGQPGSAQFGPDDPFFANIMAGPNTNSHADKVFAGVGSAGAIVSAITGTGRHGLGKDPAVSYGHEQLKDPDAGFDTESVNRTTFHRSTTDATLQTINVDSINPPAGAGVWITMKVVCFNDASTVGMARIRAGFIQRLGAGNLAINNQANIYNAVDGGPADAVFAVSGTQINLALTGVASTNLRWSGTLEWQYCSVDEAFPP